MISSWSSENSSTLSNGNTATDTVTFPLALMSTFFTVPVFRVSSALNSR